VHRPSHGGGTYNAFVAKLTSNLRTLSQSTYLGGSGSDGAAAIALDSSGNVYVAGSTASTNFPGTIGGAQSSNSGNNGAFVAKVNASLTSFIQSTYLGGISDSDAATAIALNPSRNVYVTGRTFCAEFSWYYGRCSGNVQRWFY